MDLQRYLLIGAIAFLSFMLLTEWVRFQDERALATTTEQHHARESGAESGIPATPSLASPEARDDSLIPDTVARTDEVPDTSVLAQPAATGDRLVRVRTDVLELDIDLVGGDITYVALPKHFARLDTPDLPFVLLEQTPQRTYIAQSGLIGTNGIDTSAGRARFETTQSSFELAPGQDTLVVDLLHVNGEDVSIIKRFTLRRGDYLIDVDYVIENRSEQPWRGAMFAMLKRDQSPDPGRIGGMFAMQPYLGGALYTPDEPYKKIRFDDFEKRFTQNIEGGWLAIVQHYFVSAWIPQGGQTHRYDTVRSRDGHNLIRLTGGEQQVDPGTTGTIGSQFYAGPKDQYRLKEIHRGLDLTVDYGFLWWLCQPLFWLLYQIHKLVGNWGWSIIFVTVLVKLAFFQLNATAYRSMANMRRVQPKLMELRERYADDRQKQSQEMMALYRKEKINPLGGCLPILVQMPVFLALYWVLMESVELRHAPWILWIRDLSVMDPYFILPLLMGVSMFIQQKLNPPPPDPMQARIMQFLPVIFTFFFLWFPAGLVLYWVVNNVLSIAQQYVITKRIEQGAKR